MGKDQPKELKDIEERPPQESKVEAASVKYLKESGIHIARWRNEHDGCQMLSVLVALGIFSHGELTKVAESDRTKRMLIRPSLVAYVKDSYRVPLTCTMAADTNTDFKLLTSGIYSGLNEFPDGTKGLDPCEMDKTVDALFGNLDTDQWKEEIYLNLKEHSMEMIENVLKKKKNFIIRTEHMYMANYDKIVQGFNGNLSMILTLDLKKVEIINGEEVPTIDGHNVVLLFNDQQKGTVRYCNTNLKLLKKVKDDSTLFSPSLRKDGYSLKDARIRYIMGKRRSGIEEKKGKKGKKSRKNTSKAGKSTEKPGAKPYHPAPQKIGIRPLVYPNLSFNGKPIRTDDTITYEFFGEDGKSILHWKGRLRGNEYHCEFSPKGISCHNPGRTLHKGTSAEDIKKFIIFHSNCTSSSKSGRKPQFPRQPRH